LLSKFNLYCYNSAKLSHPLRRVGKEGAIIEWEDFNVGDELPVEVIGRPEYSTVGTGRLCQDSGTCPKFQLRGWRK
jgi:hypothetical protein